MSSAMLHNRRKPLLVLAASGILRSLPVRAIAATEDDDGNDVNHINLNDPDDQNSDADLDFP